MRDSAVTSKCPNCGGDLVWNAESQLFLCSWCSSDFPEEDIRAGGMGMMLYDVLSRTQPKIMENKRVTILAPEDNFVVRERRESIYTTAGVSAEQILAVLSQN